MTDKTDIAAQLSKRILHYADMASCTSEGTSVLGADLLKLIGDTINDLIGKLEVVSKSEWKLAGELVELQMTFNALQKKDNSCTLGVGEGSGRLFVHGDYDSIKATQKIILERDALKAKLANPVVLPTGYSARSGHPFHEGERNVMIPHKQGDWLSRFDVEHAIHVAGFTVKGE